MINKLIANIKKTGAPIVVGLDPMLNYIPKQIQEAAFKEFGETLEGAAEAIWQYNKGIVDATYDLIPAVKPQIAMYEQFGIPGLMAYKRTVDYCKEKDLVVIGDIKRNSSSSHQDIRQNHRPVKLSLSVPQAGQSVIIHTNGNGNDHTDHGKSDQWKL